jgi:hypothetical protein
MLFEVGWGNTAHRLAHAFALKQPAQVKMATVASLLQILMSA